MTLQLAVTLLHPTSTHSCLLNLADSKTLYATRRFDEGQSWSGLERTLTFQWYKGVTQVLASQAVPLEQQLVAIVETVERAMTVAGQGSNGALKAEAALPW